jgi:surface antigen
MTLEQFVAKYNGKPIDFDGAYGNQCVDLYRQYVKEVLNLPQTPPVVGAKDIWTSNTPNFDKITNTPTGIPPVGAIMIWGSRYGAFGHVAIVTAATLNTFTCFSQNDPVGSLCGLKTYKTYYPTLGWLVAKETMTADEMVIKKSVFEQLVTKSTDWDSILAYIPATSLDNAKAVIGGIRGRITELETKLGTAQAEMKNREEQVVRLKADLLASENSRIDLETNLNAKIADYEELAVAKGKQYIELQQALTTIETLRQQAAQGEVAITLKDFFNLLWNQKIVIKKG